ncbi:creatininase family protein [Halalkalicoccus subterraneus]|uniref:creatininase family protein n=1 Tax=Halalkalicoccus subterraneus TaxID=2675002 RepID=UPI000EFBDD29|nr:creatininase family protein [Halalkalicoccus subterraneus]
MHLSEVTWTDAADAETDLALLPVGSTEQHGPHAPLGTDVETAKAVAEAASEAYDGEAVVAPAIPVSIAEEHRHFSGTLWVSPDTFRSYVRETVASLAFHGWDRVILVNGHGGNVPALGEVCATISRHDAANALAYTWFEGVGDHRSDMGHGGPLETALLRWIDPDLVREDRIEEAREGAAERWGEWVSRVNLAVDSAEFTENGVVGDPGEESGERGEELLALASAALVELMEVVEGRDFTPLERR